MAKTTTLEQDEQGRFRITLEAEVCAQLGWDKEQELELMVDGDRVWLQPLQGRQERFEQAASRIMRDHDHMFKILAQ